MESRRTSTDFFWDEDTPPARACATLAAALATGVSISSSRRLGRSSTMFVGKKNRQTYVKRTDGRMDAAEAGVCNQFTYIAGVLRPQTPASPH